MQTIKPNRHSLAWLLISASAARWPQCRTGVIAGRAGLPIDGGWLLGAGLLAHCRSCCGSPDDAGRPLGRAAAVLVGSQLSAASAWRWRGLHLPLGFSVDAIHHTQLITWMATTMRCQANGATRALLGEMAAYPMAALLCCICVG